jgi:hypothetical protein
LAVGLTNTTAQGGESFPVHQAALLAPHLLINAGPGKGGNLDLEKVAGTVVAVSIQPGKGGSPTWKRWTWKRWQEPLSRYQSRKRFLTPLDHPENGS